MISKVVSHQTENIGKATFQIELGAVSWRIVIKFHDQKL